MAWPSWMPEADAGLGYGEDPGSPLLVTEMQSGPPQVRGQSSAVLHYASAGYVLDQAQDALWDAWHIGTALHGTLPVDDWPHPRRKVPVRALILHNDVKRQDHQVMYIALMLTKVYVLS